MKARTLAIGIVAGSLIALALAACVPIYGLGPSYAVGPGPGGFGGNGGGRMDPWKGYSSIDYCGLICW